MQKQALLLALALCRAGAFADPVTPTLLTVAQGYRHTVHAVYPAEKIKSDVVPPVTPVQELRLVAAQNEIEPFLLLVSAQTPFRDVEVVPGVLTGEAGDLIPPDKVTVYRVGFVHLDQPSGTGMKNRLPYRTGTGAYPDPLVRGKGRVRPGRNLQFWVSVRVPEGIRPGRYRGEVRVRFRREGWMPKDRASAHKIPLSVTVRPFALPSNPLRNIGVAATRDLPEWLRREDVLQALRQNFVEHGHVPDPLPSPVVSRTKQGQWRIDSAAWENAAAELLDRRGLPFLMLPVFSDRRDGQMQGVYFLYHYPMVTRQRWFGEVICEANGELAAGFREGFGAYLQHMAAIVRKRGWAGKLFLTTMDEPYTYHASSPEDRKLDTPENNYRVVRNFVGFVRRAAPEFKTFITADPCDGLNGHIDCWCLRNLIHAEKAKERAERYHEQFLFCENYRHFIDFPAISTRSMGWLAWRIGAKGWLTYETLGQFTHAWEEPVYSYPIYSGPIVWGMGQFFYPDIQGAGGIAGSIRWEMMREGCEDYGYVTLLDRHIQRLSGQTGATGERVREAAGLIQEASQTLAGFPGDRKTVPDGEYGMAQCNSVAHRFRERIGDWIEILQDVQE